MLSIPVHTKEEANQRIPLFPRQTRARSFDDALQTSEIAHAVIFPELRNCLTYSESEFLRSEQQIINQDVSTCPAQVQAQLHCDRTVGTMPFPSFMRAAVQDAPDESLVDYVTPDTIMNTPEIPMMYRRIWCPNSPGDGATRRQLLEIAARFIPMIAPGVDFVVLPANVPELRYFFLRVQLMSVALYRFGSEVHSKYQCSDSRQWLFCIDVLFLRGNLTNHG